MSASSSFHSRWPCSGSRSDHIRATAWFEEWTVLPLRQAHRFDRFLGRAVLGGPGIEFALRLFPSHFSMKRERLIWGLLDNRPFLRLYHSYGLSLMRQGEAEKALEVFGKFWTAKPGAIGFVRSHLGGGGRPR